MKTCIVTVGCSASGKTTWAESQAGFKVICRDDIRALLMMARQDKKFSWADWNWKHEPEVTDIQRAAIAQAIRAEKNVILADTNLNYDAAQSLAKPFSDAGYSVEYKRFDVSFETLLHRDLHRGPLAIGSKVIAQQWDKMKLNWPSDLEKRLRETLKTPGKSCFICDIDGTLATHDGIRGHYDLEEVSKDEVVMPVRTIVKSIIMDSGMQCVFLSGREGTDQCARDTKKWIGKWIGHVGWTLMMRKQDDQRRDNIIKLELLDELMATGMRPQFAIDDRGRCIRAWRSVGLFTLQVGNPYIEF